MSQPAHLRVILSDHDVQKLTLPSGIPGTVGELLSVVRDTFGISGEFCLHYKDADFDANSSFSSLTEGCLQLSDDAGSSVSSHDTLPVSPGPSTESPTQRSKSWPSEFAIPRFSSSTEILLQSGNDKFDSSGTLFHTKDLISLLPDILGTLAEVIFEYTAYPSSAQISQVAEALIKKHPCLKEPGSFNGCYGWIQRLKYKMNNFRSKLRGVGYPEIVVNSLKRKPPHEQTPAKNIKKLKKAEVNYLPPHPQGETSASLEKDRVELLHEVMKNDNCTVVAEKMAKTFSLRREEIIYEAPVIKDFMERWPALFDAIHINDEFKRITTISLESTFMRKLDQCIPKLMDKVSSRGGATGARIRQIKDMLLEDNTIDVQREVAIRCLVVYLGEKEEELFKEFSDTEEFEAGLDGQMMKIAIIGDKSTPGPDHKTAAIVVEGTKILEGKDIPRCCALLMGIIYALNLSYRKELKYTFEVFQKLFLELDGLRASTKVMSLKNSIF